MIKPETEVIWGSVPVPTVGELKAAQERVSQRMRQAAEDQDIEPGAGKLRQHWNEFRAASPAFEMWLENMASRLALRENDPEFKRFYYYGALDVIEILGAIAANRQFESIIPAAEEDEIRDGTDS